jgi:hypothetical protein
MWLTLSSFDRRIARHIAALLAGACVLLARPARTHATTPRDPLGARRACEAALALEAEGQKVDSREPCHSALVLGGQSEDLRNEAASMLAPQRIATLDDLAVASLLADAALRKDPTEPWGYLARCDIARRIGSADVLESCLRDLRRIAPQHPQTLAALAPPTQRLPAWVWLVRSLLLLGLFGTCLDAAARAWRRLRARRAAIARPVVAFVVVLGSVLGDAGLRAALADEPRRGPQGELSNFKIDDANPAASVPSLEARNKQPLQFGYFIQDLTARADAATKKGDHAAAARYYGALAKVAPDVALAPRKLCESLQAAGDLPRAVQACRTALTRGGATAGDFTRFVNLVLGQDGRLPQGEKEELEAVLAHLDGTATLGALLPVLRCEVALRFHDTPALEACTRTLGQVAPNDPKTVSFQWALAIDQRDRDAALRLIDRAKGLGMAKEGVATMERATNDMNRWRLARLALLVVAAVALILVGVGAARRLSERRRLVA